MLNCRVSGTDLFKGYQPKKVNSLHEKLSEQHQYYRNGGIVTDWIRRAETIHITKYLSKVNVASNYRSITCLPLVCKLSTGIISESIYGPLNKKSLMTQQKCARKRRMECMTYCT